MLRQRAPLAAALRADEDQPAAVAGVEPLEGDPPRRPTLARTRATKHAKAGLEVGPPPHRPGEADTYTDRLFGRADTHVVEREAGSERPEQHLDGGVGERPLRVRDDANGLRVEGGADQLVERAEAGHVHRRRDPDNELDVLADGAG